MPGGLSEVAAGRLAQIRHFAFDLDGTVFADSELLPAVQPLLRRLRQLGIGYTFVTNNSSRGTAGHVAHLKDLGIEATAANLYSSTDATLEALRQELPAVRRLFVLGTAELRDEFRQQGYLVNDLASEPDAVVVGFDRELTYKNLCHAAYWIARGKPFIATHPDRVCPTNEPTVLVDCGALCAALTAATGRRPDMVPGKPDRRLLDGIMRRDRCGPSELAMVGDRLYTDMAMATAAGTMGILVLTGETTAAQAAAADPAPDLVVADLGQLLAQIERVQTD